MIKQAVIEGFFPELRGGSINKVGRGKGCNNKAAISRAMGDLLKQVKGKRVHIIKATITLIDVTEEK